MKKHWPIIVITAVAAVLIFANLGNQYLWQDEAETAVIARNTLEFGFPRAFDGKNLVNPKIRTGYGEDYRWLYHPWGQFYIAAASFKLFGAGTFTARLPFALMGVINVVLLYWLTYMLTGRRFTAGCAAFLMTVSVPYLLLMRQCRYYAPAVLLVLIILIFYSRFRESRRTPDLVVVTAGLVALGHTVHGMFVPMLAALGTHYVLFSFDRKTFPRVLAAGMLSLAAVIPWFLSSESITHTGDISPDWFRKNLEFQVRMINKYIFPVVFFVSAYAVRAAWKRRWKIELAPGEKNMLKIISVVVIMSVLAFCFARERQFRYLVYFIPFMAVIEAMILLRLAKFSRALLALFLFVSMGTGALNMGVPNYYFPKYLYEITHDYDGPVEGIVKFLEKNAEPGDTVKIIFGDQPLMFYTDLAIDNSWIYDDEHMPKWVVFRRGWHERLGNTYYTRIRKTYKSHLLDYPDIKWENRPGDLDYHRFRTDREAPAVIVFERTER